MDGAILATLFNLTPSFCSPARHEVFGLCPEQPPARAGGVAGECGVAGRGPGGGAGRSGWGEPVQQRHQQAGGGGQAGLQG